MTLLLKKIKVDKWSIFFMFLLFFNKNINAQDFQLAGIHYVNFPKAEIKDNSGNQKASFQEFGTFINIPKKLKNNKTVLMNGVGYGFVEVSAYNLLSLQTSNYKKNLQAFYYQFMLIHKWNKKWITLVNLKPTIASDFEQKLSFNDLVVQGSIMATRIYSNKFRIGTGIVQSTRWGKPIILPIVNMFYKSNKHNVFTILPINMQYTYSILPEEKLKFGIKYAVNGANFNISNKQEPDTPSIEIDKINYSRANIGALAHFKFSSNLRLEAYGGICAWRIYKLIDIDNNVHDFDSEMSPFFSVGFVMVPPRNK